MSYKWQYHPNHTKIVGGKGMMLLGKDEVMSFWTIFERLDGNSNLFYHPSDCEQLRLYVLQFQQFGDEISLVDLHNLNDALNRLFSNDGWRSVRKSINKANRLKQKAVHANAVVNEIEPIDKWHYSGVTPAKGKRLKLLSNDEVDFCLPIITAFLDDQNIHNIDKNHFRGVCFTDAWQASVFQRIRAFKRTIKNIKSLRGGGISCTDLMILNEQCNSLFSDLGWKLIRQRQAQKKRRAKKNIVELSSVSISDLNAVKSAHNLKSFDEVIGYLVDEAKVNPDLVELHNAMSHYGLETYADVIEILSIYHDK